MSTSSSDSVFGLHTQRVEVPPGATLGVLVDGNAIPGANSLYLKFYTGQTMVIAGVTYGATMTAAQLVTAQQTGYPMDALEKLSISGPVRFYAIATGATGVLALQWGKSNGT